MNHLSKLIFIFFAISRFSHQTANFTVQMSSDQYIWQFAAHIAENNMKKCYVLPGRDQNACKNYCLFYYDYVPSLPFKNAQVYNPATKQCQPKIFCPPQLLIRYDQQNKICMDIIIGNTVSPVDAPKPNYKSTLNVTIICQHGKIITFLGRLDCECQLGWGSEHIPNFGSITAFKKCNIPLGVGAYFPNFKKIYYDESYDNKFPSPALDDYWFLLIQYYTRSLKYSIVKFFFPYEVQIVLLAIPKQTTFNEGDWIIIYWIIIFFLLLCLITSFQRCSRQIESE